MARVKLTDVKKIYQGGVVAVHDFNLDIADKEFIVFVGPSGCGKSTTLRMVAGLEEISEGTVEIDGEVVNDLQPKDRKIAMVFQNYALYPHLTVFENMAFPLRLDKNVKFAPLKEEERAKAEKKLAELEQQAKNQPEKAEKLQAQIDEQKELLEKGKKQRGYSQEEVYQRVTNAAEILGITQYLTRKPKALSGGQRQRVAIGRAMVKDCKVFLMDEPLSNLDAKLRNQMRAEIILLRKKIDTTFIYVTHDQTEAMTLGDRIVIMKDGFIMQVGTPSEVFDKPANLFVAEFIGAPKMNTVPAKLVESAGKYSVELFGASIPVTGEKAELLKEKKCATQDIILGFRPEHVALAPKAAKDNFKVTIQVNEMMGSELHLHVLTEDNTSLIVRIPTVQLSDQERLSMVAGKELFVSFESKVMSFFNPETESSLIYRDISAELKAQVEAAKAQGKIA